MTKDQQKVRAFLQKHSLLHKPQVHALDLVSELGEVAKEILKGSSYSEAETEKTKEVESELGDAYYSLLALAESFGVDLEAALELVLKKYESRLEKSGAGSENE